MHVYLCVRACMCNNLSKGTSGRAHGLMPGQTVHTTSVQLLLRYHTQNSSQMLAATLPGLMLELTTHRVPLCRLSHVYYNLTCHRQVFYGEING